MRSDYGILEMQYRIELIDHFNSLAGININFDRYSTHALEIILTEIKAMHNINEIEPVEDTGKGTKGV